MIFKILIRRLTLVAAFALPFSAVAGPVAEPGDIALRHDIQVLADYGAISGPVTTWPISWDAVLHDLEAVEANDVVLPNKILTIYNRVLERARYETTPSLGVRVMASGAEKPTVIRGFAGTPREDAEVRGQVTWNTDRVNAVFSAGVVDAPIDGDEFRLDHSRIAFDIGNWSLAASTMDRWWGPGWDGSLILSNNARPVPALTLGRRVSRPFETKWLSWIGPWSVTAFIGQLEKERAVPDARLMGARVAFRPVPSLEIGLSRTAIWCGETRPCDLETFGRILIGRDNLGDEGTTFENEPSNQLAGFDVRWTNFWFRNPVSVYAQMIGEDEAGGLPSQYLAQFGIEGSGITRNQSSFRWFAEAAGTTCDILKSPIRYGCGYRHGIYRSGYSYKGRIIGHGLDNDALVVSAGVVVVSDAGNSWHILARNGDVNRVGPELAHSVAPLPQELASIDIQHVRMTALGEFSLGVGFERRQDISTGENTRESRAFIRWSSPAWGQ